MLGYFEFPENLLTRDGLEAGLLGRAFRALLPPQHNFVVPAEGSNLGRPIQFVGEGEVARVDTKQQKTRVRNRGSVRAADPSD